MTHQFDNIAALSAGMKLGHSDWITIDQTMIDEFARSTRDEQWIHTDPQRAARESPFGGTIAHGFLSLSLLSGMIESMLHVRSARMGVNYGLNKVRFPNFVPVNCRLRLQLGIISVERPAPDAARIIWDCVVEREGESKPVCVAEFITLLYE